MISLRNSVGEGGSCALCWRGLLYTHLTLRGMANSTIVFLQNISKQMTVKGCKVCSKLQCSAAHDFVHKKVLVLNEEILFSNNKNWLFEPNDAIFTFSDYNYTFSGKS